MAWKFQMASANPLPSSSSSSLEVCRFIAEPFWVGEKGVTFSVLLTFFQPAAKKAEACCGVVYLTKGAVTMRERGESIRPTELGKAEMEQLRLP